MEHWTAKGEMNEDPGVQTNVLVGNADEIFKIPQDDSTCPSESPQTMASLLAFHCPPWKLAPDQSLL